MKKPEEYKCHEIMLKYSNSHSHEDFQCGSEIIFKHEDLEKIFNDCGFTSYRSTGHSAVHYHKDGVSTNERFWDFIKDVRLREINEMYLINEVTKSKVRCGLLKYFGEFVLYEMIERYFHWGQWCFISTTHDGWVLNDGVTFEQIRKEFVPQVYEWLKEHLVQAVQKVSLDNKKRVIKQKKQTIESDADLKIMDLMDELKKYDFKTEVQTNPSTNISKIFTIKKLFHNYTGMINPTITIRKNISGSYDISTNINQYAEFDKIRKLPNDGDRIVEIVNMILGDFKTLPTNLRHSVIENFPDVK